MVVLEVGEPALVALRRPGRGQVVAVSGRGPRDRALNLALADGPWVGLLGAARPLHPWAARCPDPLPELLSGAPVTCDGESVVVGGHRYSLPAEPTPLNLAGAPLAAAHNLAAYAWSPPAHTPLGIALRFVVQRARDLSPVKRPFALSGIVGLGEGLTPGGDDFLVGYLAGLEASGQRALGDALKRELSALPLYQRTTRLSAQLIEAALAGLYGEPLLDLVEALGTPREPAATERLLAIGHTSGEDTLAGLASALTGDP